MRKTKYTVKYTTGFKKDYKRAIKRGLKIELLEQVVALLAMGEPLPEKNRDHDLSGDWVGHRECHILPDWLLIYRIEDDVLVLTLPLSPLSPFSPFGITKSRTAFEEVPELVTVASVPASPVVTLPT